MHPKFVNTKCQLDMFMMTSLNMDRVAHFAGISPSLIRSRIISS